MVDPRSWFPLSKPTVPSSPTKPSGNWDVEKDTSALFCSHSIEEIRQMERQTRLDIERKKEDLRQMVGERYRDLIDAADSIVDMKTCSEHVNHSVSTMEQLCHKLQQTHFLRGSGGLRGPPVKSESHALAAQMKLLADTPDKIWGCLERQNFLTAARLFLFARHVYSNLQLAGTASAMLQKLWHSTACFKDTILECCSRHLQSNEEGEGAVVQSLCALVLLEGSSPRQVFTRFLLARKAAVQDVFHPSNEHAHRSVKAQVCQLVHVIRKSLVHIAAIFSQKQSLDGRQTPSLLLQTLIEFTSREKQDCQHLLIPDHIASRLPLSTKEFVPSLRASGAGEIPTSVVHSSCEDWIATYVIYMTTPDCQIEVLKTSTVGPHLLPFAPKRCIADVRQGVGQLLCHVTSVKSLSSIRDAVHKLLAQPALAIPEESDSSQWAGEWSNICFRVLGRELCVWNEFLRPLLLERAKVVLSQLFSEAQSVGTTTLKQLLRGVESDPTLYTPDTHVSSHLWREEGMERGGGEMSALTLKAKACTPSIYSFCQSFGEKLELIIHDASHYLPPPTQDSLSRKQSTFPFSLHGDAATMQEYLQQSTTQCISRFLESVDERVSDLRKELEGRQSVGHSPDLVDRLLLIGRICQALTDCCPSLTLLSQGCRRQEARAAARTRRLPSQRKEIEVEKNMTSEMLCQRAALVHRVWVEWCTRQFGKSLRDQLSAEMELNSLASTLAWEEITIAEEAESGKQVSSVIRVPAQASVYVMSLLFSLCQEISRVGGHAINRPVLLHLSSRVLAEVLSSYESLLGSLSSPVPQDCALQLLFNVKFTASVLGTPEESQGEIEGRLKSISEQLQSFVDPFDLDVFLPHLIRNMERQLTRSAVLLGMLLTVKGGPTPGVYKLAPGSVQEKHIVIPLAPSMSRLPSLPISVQQLQPQIKHAQVYNSMQQPTTFLGTVTFFHHL